MNIILTEHEKTKNNIASQAINEAFLRKGGGHIEVKSIDHIGIAFKVFRKGASSTRIF